MAAVGKSIPAPRGYVAWIDAGGGHVVVRVRQLQTRRVWSRAVVAHETYAQTAQRIAADLARAGVV